MNTACTAVSDGDCCVSAESGNSYIEDERERAHVDCVYRAIPYRQRIDIYGIIYSINDSNLQSWDYVQYKITDRFTALFYRLLENEKP